MSPEELKERDFNSELIYSTSRSSGPGGQNVNKVNTKVELRFRLISTSLFSEAEKELISKKLKNRINNDEEIILVSQSGRTQLQNKIAVTDKFFDLLSRALTIPLRRKPTKPSYTSKIKRIEDKRSRGLVKKMRKKSGESEDL